MGGCPDLRNHLFGIGRDMRTAIYLLLVAAACLLSWQFYATARSNREAARMDVVFTQLSSKLDTHKRAAGQYPDSLAVLPFTNLTEVQMLGDVRKIIYQRTASGYTLSYTGFAGYHKSHDFSDTRTPH